MERREFLAGAVAAAAAPAFTARPADAHADSDQAASLRAATAAFRRMDGTTPPPGTCPRRSSPTCAWCRPS